MPGIQGTVAYLGASMSSDNQKEITAATKA